MNKGNKVQKGRVTKKAGPSYQERVIAFNKLLEAQTLEFSQYSSRRQSLACKELVSSFASDTSAVGTYSSETPMYINAGMIVTFPVPISTVLLRSWQCPQALVVVLARPPC